MNFRNSLAAALLLLATPAAAEPDSYIRAMAAGYKAQFVCSAHFNAGRSLEQIEGDELARIYPELRPFVSTLAATINEDAKTVSVGIDGKLPPRVAAWRPWLGCSGLPIGAGPASAANLPRLAIQPPQFIRAPDWPYGDVGAAARPKGKVRALDAAIGAAFDRKSYGDGSETTAVLIVQNGKIVAERYRDGFGPHIPQRTWSVAKSIAGTLLGVAAQQGIIDLDAPARIPDWQVPRDPRASITVDQLMRMASGLHSDSPGNRTDAVYLGGSGVAETTATLPLEAVPGTRFRYANNDTLLAVRALKAAIGDDAKYHAFPFTELFWKLGMTTTFAETDWRGDFILSSQVWTTPRDMARLGLLYLNDGVWNGERLLPEGFIHRVTNPSGPQPATGFGYGATFWLAGENNGLPAGTFAALGNRGQHLVIVPARNILIIRRGFDAIGGGGEGFDIARFSADVLKTLK